jgi:hypothetical protein
MDAALPDTPRLAIDVDVYRKHVFADLTPYKCIRARYPSSGMFYSSKRA